MNKANAEWKKSVGLQECQYCGYNNKINYIKIYGQCHLCKKVINEKAYFEMKLIKDLRLWRKEIEYDKKRARKKN